MAGEGGCRGFLTWKLISGRIASSKTKTMALRGPGHFSSTIV